MQAERFSGLLEGSRDLGMEGSWDLGMEGCRDGRFSGSWITDKKILSSQGGRFCLSDTNTDASCKLLCRHLFVNLTDASCECATEQSECAPQGTCYEEDLSPQLYQGGVILFFQSSCLLLPSRPLSPCVCAR